MFCRMRKQLNDKHSCLEGSTERSHPTASARFFTLHYSLFTYHSQAKATVSAALPADIPPKIQKQKTMKKIFAIIASAMMIMGCNAQNEKFKSLTVDEYEKAIRDTAVVRLDVRTAEEFAEGHIKDALNIDVLKADFEKKAIATLPKKKTIAINCRSGKRSKKAAMILAAKGYKIIELDEGYNGWVAAGKKTVKK